MGGNSSEAQAQPRVTVRPALIGTKGFRKGLKAGCSGRNLGSKQALGRDQGLRAGLRFERDPGLFSQTLLQPPTPVPERTLGPLNAEFSYFLPITGLGRVVSSG